MGAAQVQRAREGLVLDNLQFQGQMLPPVMTPLFWTAHLSSLTKVSLVRPGLSTQLNSSLDKLFASAEPLS